MKYSWLHEIVTNNIKPIFTKQGVVFHMRDGSTIFVGWYSFDHIDPFTWRLLVDYLFPLD